MNRVCIYQFIVVGLKFIRLILLSWMVRHRLTNRLTNFHRMVSLWWNSMSPRGVGRESSNALSCLMLWKLAWAPALLALLARVALRQTTLTIVLVELGIRGFSFHLSNTKVSRFRSENDHKCKYNGTFWSWVLSCLAFKWKGGRSLPCFDRSLVAIVILMMLFSCVSVRIILRKKSTEVSIETMSTSTSLSFKD